MTRLEHLLTIAMEECCELAIRLSKAKRFGLHEVQPGQSLTNAERCRYEYSDLAATLEMIAPPTAAGSQIHPPSARMMDEKRAKVEQFLEYSRECGTLQEPELRKGYAILFDDGPEAIEARLGTESELPTDRENAAHLRKRLETK